MFKAGNRLKGKAVEVDRYRVLQQKKPVVDFLPDTFSYTQTCREMWVVRHERALALLKTN